MKEKKTWIAILTLLIGLLTAGLFYIETGDKTNTVKIISDTIVDVINANSTTEIPERLYNR